MPHQDPGQAALLAAAREIVAEAGRLALGHFRPGAATSARVHYKSGGSPVTDADLAVDRMLRDRLSALAPGYGWLSEETADTRERLSARRVWVVDPIDGTRAFARGDRDWTVAVALVEDGVAIAGFVVAPALGSSYEALPGEPARRDGRAIAVSARDALAGASIAGPKPALDTLAAGASGFSTVPKIHSLAYRIVRVAEGAIDGGLAGESAHDWDLAAAHAILTAAGGRLVGPSGSEPLYNRPSTVHEPLVAANPALVPPLLRAFPGRQGKRRGQAAT